jgi:glycosyltransferase involved in cell wall biosynthesis
LKEASPNLLFEDMKIVMLNCIENTIILFFFILFPYTNPNNKPEYYNKNNYSHYCQILFYNHNYYDRRSAHFRPQVRTILCLCHQCHQIQYEPGLYGLKLDMFNPAKTSTNIDFFYKFCKVPIITTFDSAYPFRQWMNLPIPIYERPQDHYLIKRTKRIISYWARLINYRSFHRLNTQKLAQSAAGIVFSEFMSGILGTEGCHVIFHGSDRQDSGSDQIKSEIKKSYSIPDQGRIALALGYATATKGWDMIEKMDIPDHWTIVINPSKNGYNDENYYIGTKKRNLLNLHMDFLSEEQLSALFSCADAVILPYKVSSGSGVMFDGLSYGLPFVATQLAFFEEFAFRGLGIVVKRKAEAFSKGLLELDASYDKYVKKISDFKKEIAWQEVAKRHAELYRQIVKRKEQAVAYPSRVRSKRVI